MKSYVATQQGAKYALVNEETGALVQGIGEMTDILVAADAFEIADSLRPGWREEGLRLWLRVGGQP